MSRQLTHTQEPRKMITTQIRNKENVNDCTSYQNHWLQIAICRSEKSMNETEKKCGIVGDANIERKRKKERDVDDQQITDQRPKSEVKSGVTRRRMNEKIDDRRMQKV